MQLLQCWVLNAVRQWSVASYRLWQLYLLHVWCCSTRVHNRESDRCIVCLRHAVHTPAPCRLQNSLPSCPVYCMSSHAVTTCICCCTCRYKHTQLHPEDLNKVVVHYGHVFPFRLGEFGCINLGYDIYCPDQIVLPEELLHEVCWDLHPTEGVQVLHKRATTSSVAAVDSVQAQVFFSLLYNMLEGLPWQLQLIECNQQMRLANCRVSE